MGQRSSRYNNVDSEGSLRRSEPPQTPIENVIESEDNARDERSLSEVRFSSRSLGKDEQKDPIDDDVKCDIRVSAERSQHSLEIQRPDEDKDQDEQDFKACDEKSVHISKHPEDFRLSSFRVRDERLEAEEQISKIHRPDKEDEREEEQEVFREVPKQISKEEWKRRLIANTEDVTNLYKVGKQLGKGSYGSVFEAERCSDGLKVALKYVPKTTNMKFLHVPGHRKALPNEVAIMMIMQKKFIIPEILQLLEWFEEPDRYILVLERPANSEDLSTFMIRRGGCVDEVTARIIMRQAITAAQECCTRGVFHRDIKLENLLVNPKTLKVKLIDFGCSIRLKRGYVKKITGTEPYLPPEVFISNRYSGKPATVWSLGMLLFRMLHGRFPYAYELHNMYDASWSDRIFSHELCLLMRYTLQFKDKKRIKVKNMLKHEWFHMLS